jgi:hypothetical protein
MSASPRIKEGKIDGAAVTGPKQRDPLDFELALTQLRARLSINERFGLNGLNTNLSLTPAGEPPAARRRAPSPAAPVEPDSGSVEDRIKC